MSDRKKSLCSFNQSGPLSDDSALRFCHDFLHQECQRDYCRFLHGNRNEEAEYKRTGKLPERLARLRQGTDGRYCYRNYNTLPSPSGGSTSGTGTTVDVANLKDVASSVEGDEDEDEDLEVNKNAELPDYLDSDSDASEDEKLLLTKVRIRRKNKQMEKDFEKILNGNEFKSLCSVVQSLTKKK